ncbi:Hypothetical protein SMAX5B_016275, partial [Scophthalmus maximus]
MAAKKQTLQEQERVGASYRETAEADNRQREIEMLQTFAKASPDPRLIGNK